jgi:hypothetical protein
MSSPARPLSPGWRLLEALFQRAYRMRPLHEDPSCLLAYNLYRHSGPEVTLPCGAVVRSGDRVMEIHFRREALLPLMGDGDPTRMAIGLLKLGDRDIPLLAEALERDPALREVRALHALTLFHRGISRYGFTAMPARSPREERWFTAWHRLLLARDHAHGAAHVRENAEKLVTRHVWVSRDELIRRFGAAGVDRRRARGAKGGPGERGERDRQAPAAPRS